MMPLFAITRLGLLLLLTLLPPQNDLLPLLMLLLPQNDLLPLLMLLLRNLPFASVIELLIGVANRHVSLDISKYGYIVMATDNHHNHP